MATYGKSRTTTASPETVWRLWSDPANWTQWNSGIRSMDVPVPLVAGARGKMETAQGSKHDVTFVAVNPPRGLTLTSSGAPGVDFVFTCEIAPNGSGSTIAQSVSFSGPLAFLFGPLMGPQMAKHFVPVLDDLADAAERAS